MCVCVCVWMFSPEIESLLVSVLVLRLVSVLLVDVVGGWLVVMVPMHKTPRLSAVRPEGLWELFAVYLGSGEGVARESGAEGNSAQYSKIKEEKCVVDNAKGGQTNEEVRSRREEGKRGRE